MALCELNGWPVVAGTLSVPRLGCWRATLTVDCGDVLEGVATVLLGEVEFKGYIRRAGMSEGGLEVTLVGGAGGLGRTVLEARGYRSAPLKLPLTDILGAAGETLATSSSSSVLDYVVNHWATRESAASEALSALIAFCDKQLDEDIAWRAMRDGTIWVGAESWPEVTAEVEVYAEDARQHRVSLSLTPTLLPGTTFHGQRLAYVEHHIAGHLHTDAWFERPEAGSATDRIKAGLAVAIRNALPSIDYQALYPAEVVAQNADGTLDVKPDNPRFPELAEVPLRHPFPGLTAKVSAGARVLIGFEEGDVSLPVATLWEMASLTSLHLGGSSADGSDVTDYAALASKVDALATSLKSAITGAVIVAADGGASFKATLLAALNLPASPWLAPSTACTKVKVK